MTRGSSPTRVAILLLLNIILAATFFTHSDARRGRSMQHMFGKRSSSKLKKVKHLDLASLLLQREIMTDDGASNANTSPYVSSPLTLPPYESLGPVTLPPYCVYPPSTPSLPTPSVGGSPPVSIPSPPSGPIFGTPPPFSIPLPPPGPTTGGSPPSSIPSSPLPPSPVSIPFPPSVPAVGGSPPISIPSVPTTPPPVSIPSSPPYTVGTPTSPYVFLPPIVYPPPVGPPPPRQVSSTTTTWCVAKPTVPDPILEEAMNYACGSGADCEPIQSSGPCYAPNTYFAHASYAFNSYWQKTRSAGGSCSFGGVAILVTRDPSYDGCHFVHA